MAAKASLAPASVLTSLPDVQTQPSLSQVRTWALAGSPVATIQARQILNAT